MPQKHQNSRLHKMLKINNLYLVNSSCLSDFAAKNTFRVSSKSEVQICFFIPLIRFRNDLEIRLSSFNRLLAKFHGAFCSERVF